MEAVRDAPFENCFTLVGSKTVFVLKAHDNKLYFHITTHSFDVQNTVLHQHYSILNVNKLSVCVYVYIHASPCGFNDDFEVTRKGH